MDTLIQILLTGAVGSVCLAWMPASSGSRRTLRDQLSLGALALLLGVPVLWVAALGGVSPWIVLAIGALLLVLRFALRPHALTPRHEPAIVRESTFANAALLLAWCATGASLFASNWFGLPHGHGPSGFASALLLATIVVVDSALGAARCRALVRAAAVSTFGAVVACAPTSFDEIESLAPMYFAAGAASTIGWYRRADRRDLILSAAFFAATILPAREGLSLAAAGMLTLVIGTAAPSRRVAIQTCAAAAVLCGTVRFVWHDDPARVESLGFSNTLYVIIGVLFAVVLTARWWDLRRLRLPQWNPSGAAVGHERAMLLRTLLFALIFVWIARAMRLEVRPDFALLPALFVLVILFGSSLERLCDRG